MSNRIVKDFMDWNLITEMNDMVGVQNTAISGVSGNGGGPGSHIPTAAAAVKGTSGTSGSGNRSRAVASNVSAGTDGTAGTTAQLVPAAVDKLSKEIAEMIVALFANTEFWDGKNDLKLGAKSFDDNEETGVKIFEDYWTTYILPKINMLPAGNKNKETLTAAKTQISTAINARDTSFTFQIVTSASSIPTSYTINPDF